MTRLFFGLCILTGMTSLMGTSALAEERNMNLSAFMSTGKLTSIPIGHALFCRALPEECVPVQKQRAKLTQERWKNLLQINSAVNTAIKPVTDEEQYGELEFWTYPQHSGDCEDYALLKRHILIEQGWPESSLLITVVRQMNGEGHAVLTVRTDRGDLVLDNLREQVNLWSETPYEYIKRQSAGHSGRWENIQDSRDLSIVAGIKG